MASEIWRELRAPLVIIVSVYLGFLLAASAITVANEVWPPFMAVESKSMQHNDNNSQVGIIDTGDIIVAKKAEGRGDIRTYVGSVADDYRTYGEYGDVIVYSAEGIDTPVVHRAMVELIYNGVGGFDAPELAKLSSCLWSTPEGPGRWWNLTDKIDLYRVGYSQATVVIDLAFMLASPGPVQGGLITMGDNNWYDMNGGHWGIIDQSGLVKGPIPWDKVIGKVTGEIPWLGSIRLWATGTAPDYLPHNSIFMLVVVLGVVISLPFIVWAMASVSEGIRRRGERKR